MHSEGISLEKFESLQRCAMPDCLYSWRLTDRENLNKLLSYINDLLSNANTSIEVKQLALVVQALILAVLSLEKDVVIK